MKLEGLSDEDARNRISLFDVNGLIEPSRMDLNADQKRYAHPHLPSKDFVATIDSLKPTMLIGVSTVGKAFSKQVVEKMAKLNERPIIFALSNPTDHAECTAQEAYQWSNGKVIYAAGVQFDPVQIKGETYHPGQANNFYIFPAVGLAIYVTQASRVPDEVFIAASRATADQVTPNELEKGMLFPPQKDIQKAAIKTAIAAAQKIFELNLARVDKPKDLTALVTSQLYKHEYALERNVAVAV